MATRARPLWPLRCRRARSLPRWTGCGCEMCTRCSNAAAQPFPAAALAAKGGGDMRRALRAPAVAGASVDSHVAALAARRVERFVARSDCQQRSRARSRGAVRAQH